METGAKTLKSVIVADSCSKLEPRRSRETGAKTARTIVRRRTRHRPFRRTGAKTANTRPGRSRVSAGVRTGAVSGRSEEARELAVRRREVGVARARRELLERQPSFGRRVTEAHDGRLALGIRRSELFVHPSSPL